MSLRHVTLRTAGAEEVAVLSEGLCPQCLARLNVPEQVGTRSRVSGICSVHGWYLLRTHKGEELLTHIARDDGSSPE